VTDAGDVSAPKVAPDAAVITPPPPGCELPEVPDFTPSWKQPAPFLQAKCAATQIEALASCNFDDTADQTTCANVLKDPANKDCNNCLFTASTAKALGPVVINGNIGSLNVAGCLANFEADHGVTSCGAKYQAAYDCADLSCSATSISSECLPPSKNSCISKALETSCAAQAAEAKCADSLLAPNGIAHACNTDGLKFVEAVIQLGVLFCAGPPPDAGSNG
jgi:hypothetical protein